MIVGTSGWDGMGMCPKNETSEFEVGFLLKSSSSNFNMSTLCVLGPLYF